MNQAARIIVFLTAGTTIAMFAAAYMINPGGDHEKRQR